MTPFQIRAARVGDLADLNQMMYELHDFHHQSSPELFKTPEEVEQEKSLARYLDHPECFVFVALEQEAILGFISGHFCELQSPIVRSLQMGSIDEIYVTPSHRNRGVAEALYNRLQQSFTECGVEQLFVEAWDFNRSAVSFYQKMGFEHHIHWLRKPVK